MKKSTSTGKCNYCGEIFSKSVITKHLQNCKSRIENYAKSKTSNLKSAKFFHIKVESYKEYWLHIGVPISAKLSDIGRFLRDIWLECCGHLSAFNISGMSYSSSPDTSWRQEKSMSIKLYQILHPDLKFEHIYDFGSSTHCQLSVLSEYEDYIEKATIKLLARNEPPELICGACKKQPVVQICSYCSEDSGEGWLCKDCGSKHDCSEGEGCEFININKISNSPRVGVCGYI